MKREYLIPAVAAAMLAASLISCAGRGEPAPDVAVVPTVPVAIAARANLAGDLVLTAEFTPFQEVDVMAKVAGYVQSINVDLGDHVREGQLLATLEIPEMGDEMAKAAAAVEQADAEVANASDSIHQAESTYQLAEISYKRIQDVSKREVGLVVQQEVDESHSRDVVAEAQVAGAKSALRAAEQKASVARAEQARLKTLFKYATVTAPFTGVVTKRYANTGSMIQAGTASQSQAMPIVRVSQNNLLRLTLPVPESAVPRIHVGESVAVQVPTLGRTFPGLVARFSDKLQPSTRTMDTEVDVPNPGLTLVPGMYAEVNLRVEERNHALSIPLDAVDSSASAPRVFTVRKPGVIHIVPVSLGMETAQLVEIRSGLEEGAAVIVGRHTGLKEGDRVLTAPINRQAQ